MALPYVIVVCALTIVNIIQVTLAAPTQCLERQASAIPSFVLKYAPLVWLQSQDPYLPSDIGAQLIHTKPEVNYTPVPGAPSPLTLDNLDSLNSLGGASIYLTSLDDITKNPSWLNGVAPDASGKTNGAVSSAIIVNDHGSGVVDAFYFYFYAYNQGNTVFGQEFGDHVGDWEHNMIRFSNGLPQAVWYSQHSNGEAFTYECVEKHGQRPVSYSAKGSHANYATTGSVSRSARVMQAHISSSAHDHTIPNLNLPVGFLEDHCDQGKLWDPTLSAYSYKYDATSKTYAPYDSSYPTHWLYYVGQWGDQQLPDSNPNQRDFFGERKYTSGPTGPEDKQLIRTNVCPDNGNPCIVRPFLGP
ncbi:MAG: hypothetical protein M1830_002674 [Pleopsidium flavum]|nr:MAG: hypothetical protein M1830_002674 [Pleopsidium flavum]